ncbi:hypothetical protein BDV29DRAFT_188780 [Aspergillus leporis]|uniref:Uncharacterized protein n=1 Tax=Aspergillus leporis TaxID=41062 RepID=A0A5N5XB00_9EURO|nr:hypothetical protein BDV29DRAFT_188780 [Aspergillus leporis]
MDPTDVNSQVTFQNREAPLPVAILGTGIAVCWIANYVGMLRKSYQDRTYAMALMPLCCNFAWELVHGLITPEKNGMWPAVYVCWSGLNVAVIYTAMKFAPNEWEHAPLVQRNIRYIFAVSIVGWISAHLALVAHIGPHLAQAWGAVVCQLLLSAGGLCQLLVRGSTRGTSFFLWITRFIGTSLCLPHEILRYHYGYTDVVFNSPLGWWGTAAFFVLDGSYGICLWHMHEYEQVTWNKGGDRPKQT